MVEALANNAGFFFILLAAMWAAQLGLSYVQLRRFNRRILEVRKWGKTAVGLSGDRYRGRSYVILTIDEKGVVVNAEHFAGSTVFARVKPSPGVVGMTIQQILASPESLPVSKKEQAAFVSAATYLQEAMRKEVSQAEPEAETEVLA